MPAVLLPHAPSFRLSRRGWPARILLATLLAACGGGDGGPGVNGPVVPDAGMLARRTTPGIYGITFLTAFEDGACHTCVNAAGQAAFSVLHAGRIAEFFNGSGFQLLDSPMQQSFATGLNEAGQVSGAVAVESGQFHAVRWTPTGTGPVQPLELGAPEGGSSVATAINEAGQVAGTQSVRTSPGLGGPQRAFLWTEGVGRLDLGAPPAPFVHAQALRLNAFAQVAGSMRTDDRVPAVHGFVWSAATGFADVGTFGGPNATLKALNDAGQAAGQAEFPLDLSVIGLTHHAFVWSAAGGLRDLGTLGGRQSGAEAINHAGQVVGQADTSAGAGHAALWDANGVHDLGTLGGDGSTAVAINDAGQVVGVAAVQGSTRPHPFLWTAEQGLVDLNTRLGTPQPTELVSAFAISNSGVILALTGGHELVVLTPADGGSLNGAAHFVSPPGAWAPEPAVSGRARVNAHVSASLDGGAPSGRVRFTLRAAGLAFESTAIDWLNVLGGRAQVQGRGTLNGDPGLRFSLTVHAGGASGAPDHVRVRLWHLDGGVEVVDYDNQVHPLALGDPNEGSADQGGNLVVRGG